MGITDGLESRALRATQNSSAEWKIAAHSESAGPRDLPASD
jgi:hypothetical protein